MTQFVAFDSNVEVSGYGLLSIFSGIGQILGKNKSVSLFEKYGLYPLDQSSWYSQQSHLDMLYDFSQSTDLVALGMSAFRPNASPHVKTITDALHFLNEAYQSVHRGGECGFYEFTQIDDYLGRFICHNPYPADLEFGMLYSLLKHYKTNDEMSIEWNPKKPNRKSGADSCEFILEW